MAARSVILFDDLFDVKKLNPEGRKFDKVTRIVCKGESSEMDLVLDINSDVYPVREGEKLRFVLARTLYEDGTPDDGTYDQSGRLSLLDKFEYAMHGKVFKIDHDRSDRVAAYASFGGLLMCLKGSHRNLVEVELDMRLYCLIKKTLVR